ncbi:VIT1/CCC1 transporter family protein [Actinomadura hibisca]|uniref:VIT1/CCC1 transporter family protein n=1 Tax=Actinomadura hibisca TaxID=68565 RepID=UPI0008311A7A|nr:VIT1/CCC1 transporter family protein [Actinomadura hibisca]
MTERSGPAAEIHHQHRDVTGGWLRPAVFGAMDGLVSNFALIAGIAGGQAPQRVVLLAGLAGLAAGAFSMAAGEYISVASQSELAAAEIEVERLELARHPAAELAGMFEARGVDPVTAAEVARQLSSDPDHALAVHAREELGVAPGELPSPLLAAGSSFASFAVGALLPVLPYLLGATSLWPAALLAGLGLFGAGALVARVTSRSWWFGGLRQLALGGAAAALTYGVGALIGVNGV